MREAETRILVNDGETIVIGGLLKDIKTKNRQGVPFLSKIPLLGLLFSRETTDTGKIDLLIFITAHIAKESEFTSEAVSQLQSNLGKEPAKAKNKAKNKAGK